LTRFTCHSSRVDRTPSMNPWENPRKIKPPV